MSKRKYTHIQELVPEIKSMLASGMTQREVEQRLGLTGVRPVHELLKRANRRQKKLSAGECIQEKGRARKRPLTQSEACEKEIARLKMENELLRDFLQLGAI